MKIIMKTLMFAFVSTLMMSCSSDDDNANNSLSEEEFKAKIVGVWQIF